MLISFVQTSKHKYFEKYLENLPQHVGDVFLFQVIVDCLRVGDLMTFVCHRPGHSPRHEPCPQNDNPFSQKSRAWKQHRPQNTWHMFASVLTLTLLTCSFFMYILILNVDNYAIKEIILSRLTDSRTSWCLSRRSTRRSLRSWSRPSPRCPDTKATRSQEMMT